MNRLLTTFIVIFTLSCSSSQQQNQSGSTSLQVKGVSPSILKVTQPGFLENTQVLQPNSDNKFSLQPDEVALLQVMLPVPFQLILLRQDSLIIDLSGDHPIFSGKGSRRNQLLYDYVRKKNQLLTPFGDVFDWSRSMNEQAFLFHITSIETELVSISDQINRQNLDGGVWLDRWIQFDRSLLIANYIWTYFMSNMEGDFPLLREKVNSYLPLDVSISFFPQLANSWSFKTSYLHLIQPLYLQEIYEVTDDLLIKSLTAFDKDPILKQVMLGTIVEKDLSSFDTSLYTRYEPFITETIQIPELKLEIATLYQDAMQQLTAKTGLTSNAYVGDYVVNDVLDKLIRENSGKVIYMDIWATWCKPCLEEFKLSKQFKANFNLENITYIYVGAQSKEYSWRAMINKFELEGIHLLISEDQYDEFTHRFPIGYFPSYYILDQQGQLVTEQANYSPSHPETVKIINSLLD